jgi:Domain of unknown function (DUF6265)
MTWMATALLALAAAAAQGQPTPPMTTAQLDWLAGCWALTNAEPGSGEQWMAPAAGTMFGMARTIRRGEVRDFEFMQLRDTPRGLVFIALPNGRGETTFPLERAEGRSIAFHLPTHDFPQRVVYESPDVDTLDARIEGVRNGQSRVIRFAMKRTACPLGKP